MSEEQQANLRDQRYQLGEEMQELREEHQASEGNRIVSEIDAFGNSYRVFIGNHAELKSFLDYVDKPDVFVHLWDERHRERLDQALLEVARLLHNYIAAVFSLVDSTRTFIKKNYTGTELFEEYNERVKANFANEPLHRFLQGLRNYTLHRRLPATKATFSINRRDDGGFDYSNSLELDAEKLWEWDGWDSHARQYLDSLGSAIKLADLIDSYAPLVIGLYQWLSERLGEEHTEALQELLELETRMKEVETEWHRVWDEPEDARQRLPEEDEEHPESRLSEPLPDESSVPTDVVVEDAKGHTTVTAQIEGFDLHEDATIRLFEVPFDGLIANVTFIPSENLQGQYYTRQLNLSVYKDKGSHMVAFVQLGTDEILLLGGDRHNARLLMPPVSLRVREGDFLVWSSIGSVGEGLAVPASRVEIVLERRDIAEQAHSPEIWKDHVPNYWVGKDVLVQYHERDVHGPNAPKGEFSTYTWEDVGTFRGADSEVLQVTVHSKEGGRLPQDVGYPYERVADLKLLESK